MWGGDGAVAWDTLLFPAGVEEGLEIVVSGVRRPHFCTSTAALTPKLGQGCRTPSWSLWEGQLLQPPDRGKSRASADLDPLEVQSLTSASCRVSAKSFTEVLKMLDQKVSDLWNHLD